MPYNFKIIAMPRLVKMHFRVFLGYRENIKMVFCPGPSTLSGNPINDHQILLRLSLLCHLKSEKWVSTSWQN